jgi:hypothetical protein
MKKVMIVAIALLSLSTFTFGKVEPVAVGEGAVVVHTVADVAWWIFSPVGPLQPCSSTGLVNYTEPECSWAPQAAYTVKTMAAQLSKPPIVSVAMNLMVTHASGIVNVVSSCNFNIGQTESTPSQCFYNPTEETFGIGDILTIQFVGNGGGVVVSGPLSVYWQIGMKTD